MNAKQLITAVHTIRQSSGDGRNAMFRIKMATGECLHGTLTSHGDAGESVYELTAENGKRAFISPEHVVLIAPKGSAAF